MQKKKKNTKKDAKKPEKTAEEVLGEKRTISVSQAMLDLKTRWQCDSHTPNSCYIVKDGNGKVIKHITVLYNGMGTWALLVVSTQKLNWAYN
jgi:hypothetical protein